MLFSMIGTALVSSLLTARGEVGEIWPLTLAPSHSLAVAESPGGQGQTLVGTIVGFGEADEHEWLVQTSQGLVVVDGGSRHRQLVDLLLGEQVSFLGEFDGGEFDAFSLRRANGTVIAFPHDD